MNDQQQQNSETPTGAASALDDGLERRMILADEAQPLLPPSAGQAKVMTVTWGPDLPPCEIGHWYSPQAVAEMIAAEREACAKVCEAVISSGEFDGHQHYAAAACRDTVRERSNV